LTDGRAITHPSEVLYPPDAPVAPSFGNGSSWNPPLTTTPPPEAPAPGSLRIRERRSWRTWQLIVVGVVAALVGMVIGNSGGGGSASSHSNTTTYTLPPATGHSSSGATSSTAASPPTSSPPTSTPASSPPSSTPTSTPTTSPPATGSLRVLLGPTPQSRGNWTSTPFTVVSGQWNIGWAYQCTPAPVSGPAFQVFVFPTGASPGTSPAVAGTAASGNSVTPVSSPGSQEIQVQAPSSCVWVVKVTGVG